jgi:protein-S-isoprenylcysteine O-methyltransferase Ste14
MKFFSTIVLLVVSSAVVAHTGDHNGIWHDHGILAQALALMVALSGLAMMVVKSRRASRVQQKSLNSKTQANEKLID